METCDALAGAAAHKMIKKQCERAVPIKRVPTPQADRLLLLLLRRRHRIYGFIGTA